MPQFFMADDILRNYQKIRNDPWEFAVQCVFTKDEKDQAFPIKPFPKDLEYLKLYFRLWQRYRLLGIPKSRRMFLSWSTIILYLWDAMFHVGRHEAFVSKKESDADELLERAVFILEHIPKNILPPDLIPSWKKTYCNLEFEEIHSRIQAFPSGSDQMRQFAFSGIMGDEAAFWEQAQKMYSATFPTIENSGRMTMISSPAPGFFKDLVFDQFDDRPPPPDAKTIERFPMPGVEVWLNPKNKFLIYQLHYSADPKKKDPAYIEEIKSSMPISTFNQEFELQWDSFEGKPVYLDWSLGLHGTREVIMPHLGLPLLLGIDQGLTPACVVAQLQEDTLVILKEYTAVNMGALRFSEMVKKQLAVDFPAWGRAKEDFRVFMDPAGFNRKDTDETTYASIWGAHGFRIAPGAMNWEPRRQAVEQFLTRTLKSGPCFRVNLAECPILVRGFNGGYRYPEKSFEIEPNKIRPLKDEHSHVHDALQYLCSALVKSKRTQRKPIPEPHYSWGSPKNNYGVPV
jgi:hypothetical protein